MKKFALPILIMLFVVGNINGQGKFSLSAGGNLAIPMGDFGDAVNMGFGATVQGEYQFQEKLFGTATIGYLMWGGKDMDFGFGSVKSDFSAIPLMAGVKYFFAKGIYGHGQLGLHFFSATVETTGGFFGPSKTTASETEFAIALGVGYEVSNWDLSALLNIISDSNYIGLRAAYRFSLQ